MSFFDQIYGKLFNNKQNGIILHEVLKRGDLFRDNYQHWKISGESDDVVKMIREGLDHKRCNEKYDPEVHEFRGDYSNGLAITYHKSIPRQHFEYLFDLLSERVQKLGYKVSISDEIITERKQYIETKQKHYLKPLPSESIPIDQKYGNVVIEHILIDDQPSFIRLMVLAYNDRYYKMPLKFDDLVGFLLTE